jgi:hypothetical protein
MDAEGRGQLQHPLDHLEVGAVGVRAKPLQVLEYLLGSNSPPCQGKSSRRVIREEQRESKQRCERQESTRRSLRQEQSREAGYGNQQPPAQQSWKVRWPMKQICKRQNHPDSYRNRRHDDEKAQAKAE